MKLSNTKVSEFKINKKEIVDTVILYATTLTITLAMIYLLFPGLVTSLSAVKKVNSNVMIVNEKIDSIATNDGYLHDKVDNVLSNQYEFTGTLLDTMINMNKKLENIQKISQQTNRLINQNTAELQRLKQLYYKNSFNSNQPTYYIPKSPVQVFDSLFRKR